MNHCAGGAGAVNFGQSGVAPVSLDPNHDAILALQRWVEEGIAPDHEEPIKLPDAADR
jgi:feruloyl esterase